MWFNFKNRAFPNQLYTSDHQFSRQTTPNSLLIFSTQPAHRNHLSRFSLAQNCPSFDFQWTKSMPFVCAAVFVNWFASMSSSIQRIVPLWQWQCHSRQTSQLVPHRLCCNSNNISSWFLTGKKNISLRKMEPIWKCQKFVTQIVRMVGFFLNF